MAIQSSYLPQPTFQGSAQRYTRNLVTHQAIPRAVEVSAPPPTATAPAEASLIQGRPGGLSPRQAAAVYRAVSQISNETGGELMNRIDARA